jgi:hypothetical protein
MIEHAYQFLLVLSRTECEWRSQIHRSCVLNVLIIMGVGSLSILYPCSGNLTDTYAANLSFFLADVAAVDLSKS